MEKGRTRMTPHKNTVNRKTILANLVAIIFVAATICIVQYCSSCVPVKIKEDFAVGSNENIYTGLYTFDRDSFTDESIQFSILDYYAENLAVRYTRNGRKYLKIEGYSFIKGEELGSLDNSYVLKDLNTGIYYRIPTKSAEDPNIPTDENGISYSKSGMIGICDLAFLPKDSIYSICVLYRNNMHNELVETDKIFIHK